MCSFHSINNWKWNWTETHEEVIHSACNSSNFIQTIRCLIEIDWIQCIRSSGTASLRSLIIQFHTAPRRRNEMDWFIELVTASFVSAYSPSLRLAFLISFRLHFITSIHASLLVSLIIIAASIHSSLLSLNIFTHYITRGHKVSVWIMLIHLNFYTLVLL